MTAESELSIPQRILVQSVSIALGIVLAVVLLAVLAKVFEAVTMTRTADPGQPVAVPVEAPSTEEF